MKNPAIKQTKVKQSGVRVLHKTLDILETIKALPAGIALAELARRLEMPKPTVFRILVTLEGRGYLDRRGDGSYRLTQKLFDLQRDISLEQQLNRAAQPVMEKLVETCKETVNLGLLDGGEVVVINTLESPQAVRMTSKIGNRRYLHTTGLGKILLAGLPDKEVDRLIKIKGLPSLTQHSITGEKALMRELRQVRSQGYALDNQENELEGRCIAAAIRGPNNSTLAALSVSGPVFRTNLDRLRSFLNDLQAACELIAGGMNIRG
jgi:DNA-binding IclR family transcriptional regulator